MVKWMCLLILVLLILSGILLTSIIRNLNTPSVTKLSSVYGSQYDNNRSCTTKSCLTLSSNYLKWSNKETNPCDDFFEYVCGGFIKTESLPNHIYYITPTFSAIESMDIQLNDLLKDTSTDNEEPNYIKLMKKYYHSCKNKRLIETRGIENMKNILENLGGWPVLAGTSWNESQFDWMECLLKAKKLGLPYDFFVQLKMKSKKIHVKIGKGNDSFRGQVYVEFLLRIAKMLGARIDDEVVIKELFETFFFDRKFDEFTYQFYRRSPNILTKRFKDVVSTSSPWAEYLNKFLTPDIEITPDLEMHYEFDGNEEIDNYITGLRNLMAETPKRIQANSILWQIIKWALPYLNEESYIGQIEFNKIDGTVTEIRPRWKECISNIRNDFRVGATALYIQYNIFNTAVLGKVKSHVRYIRDEIKNMSYRDFPSFRTLLDQLEKVDETEFNVGFPEQLQDEKNVEEYYEGLEFDDDNYLNIAINLSDFLRKRSLKTLSDTTYDWIELMDLSDTLDNSPVKLVLTPITLYNILYFEESIPEYINFGYLAEKMKSFYEISGSDMKNYEETCKVFSFRYYPYSFVLDGTYLAYLNYVENNTTVEKLMPGFENFTNSQMFFISYAASRCVKIRPIYTFSNSANALAVNSVLWNSKYFPDIFNCTPGSPMKLRDDNVCRNEFYPSQS